MMYSCDVDSPIDDSEICREPSVAIRSLLDALLVPLDDVVETSRPLQGQHNRSTSTAEHKNPVAIKTRQQVAKRRNLQKVAPWQRHGTIPCRMHRRWCPA